MYKIFNKKNIPIRIGNRELKANGSMTINDSEVSIDKLNSLKSNNSISYEKINNITSNPSGKLLNKRKKVPSASTIAHSEYDSVVPSSTNIVPNDSNKESE